MRSSAGIVISWPTNSVGVVLAFTESLTPPSWNTESSHQNLDSNRLTITVPITGQSRFYRLRPL
jgi:hypothetical protein